MANKDKKFSLSRGLKDVYICEILEDNETAYTPSETVEKLIPAGTITMSADSETADTWFDNKVFASVGTESATTVSLEGARLKPAMIARITGKKVDEATGIVVDSGSFVPKYFAVSARVQMLDGTEALIWFLKGTFSIPEETGRTVDDTTDSDGMTLEFNAVKTQFEFGTGDGVKRTVMDTTDSELLDLQDWFKQVVTPANMATIAQKKKVLSSVTISPDPVESATNGSAVSLTATADVTAGTTYEWSVSGDATGSFDNANQASVQFTPSATGSCTVTVKATNNGVIVQDSVTFTVS